MSNATSGSGLKLQRGDGATPTEGFTTVGEVTNVSGPDETVEQIDVTSYDSTAREFIAALPDSGEVTFEMNLIGSNAQQQGLRTDLRAGTVRNFKLIMKDKPLETDCTRVTFAAIVKALSPAFGGVDEANKLSCTLKVTGQPVWTYASA
jgi:hypothetical protein